MSVLQGIVESIADGLGKSHDVAFKNKIKFAVKYWRAFLIKRDLERNVIDKQLLQTICLPLEYGANDVCCSVVTGCKGLKTIAKVPKAIRIKSPSYFSSVTTPKFKKLYPLERGAWQVIDSEKYGKNLMYYDLINSYMYIKKAVNLSHVLVTGIWEDPETLAQCHSGDLGVDCYADGDFPISSDLVTTITEGLISNELRIINPDDQTVDINSKNNDFE